MMMKKSDFVIVQVSDIGMGRDGEGYLIDTYKRKAPPNDMYGKDYEIFAKISIYKTWDRFTEDDIKEESKMIDMIMDRVKIL